MKYTEKKIAHIGDNRAMLVTQCALLVIAAIMLCILMHNVKQIKHAQETEKVYNELFTQINDSLGKELMGTEQDDELRECDQQLKKIIYREGVNTVPGNEVAVQINFCYEAWRMIYRDIVLARDNASQRDNVNRLIDSFNSYRDGIFSSLDDFATEKENANYQLLVILIIVIIFIGGLMFYQTIHAKNVNEMEVVVDNQERKEFVTDKDWIVSTMKILKNVFYRVRLVDVENKKEYIVYDNGEIIVSPTSCFEAVGKKASCSNCIGEGACEKKCSRTKFEFFNKGAYHMSANYIEIDNHGYVLEVISEADARALKISPAELGLVNKGNSEMAHAAPVLAGNDKNS